MEDKVDVPEEFIPLVIAMIEKNIRLRLGKPIPEELEETIKRETAELEKTKNIQNYYIADTFNLSQDEIDKLSKEDIEDEISKINNVDADSNSLKKFQHGELKKELKSLIKRDECRKNETVSSKKIAKWVREITNEGYATSESIIRARLSDMGFTSEKL